MCFVNFKATLFIFIIPFVFARIVMMLGNWAQHAFVDESSGGSSIDEYSHLVVVNKCGDEDEG